MLPERRPTRVRGLQVHGRAESVGRSRPSCRGQRRRCRGVGRHSRDTLAEPNAFEPTRRIRRPAGPARRRAAVASGCARPLSQRRRGNPGTRDAGRNVCPHPSRVPGDRDQGRPVHPPVLFAGRDDRRGSHPRPSPAASGGAQRRGPGAAAAPRFSAIAGRRRSRSVSRGSGRGGVPAGGPCQPCRPDAAWGGRCNAAVDERWVGDSRG